jgi:hypothetical protein
MSQFNKASIHIPTTDMRFFSLEIRRQLLWAGDAGIPFCVQTSIPASSAMVALQATPHA